MKKKKQKKPAETKILIRIYNPRLLPSRVRNLIEADQIKTSLQIQYSLSFYEYLKEKGNVNFQDFKKDFKETLYRVSELDPTSIEGNLAYGGRFNIGGSQMQKTIDIKAFAALYFSADLSCAIKEYTQGMDCINDGKYSLAPSRNYQLWDINKIIEFLDFPNLMNLIYKGSSFNSWGYTKAPMESQILAYWLKQKGGDGILFDSTIGNSKCIALFVRDRTHAKTLFSQVKKL